MKKSILTDNFKKCYFCNKNQNIQLHHIFGGANRKKSDKYKLIIPLCWECHLGNNGVHFNKKQMDKLHKIGQKAFIENYPYLDFMKIFYRNYLWEEEEEEEQCGQTMK